MLIIATYHNDAKVRKLTTHSWILIELLKIELF